MDQLENNSMGQVPDEVRSGQLLQVWRDYYDEIFEINLTDGSFESIMDTETHLWARKGFVNIEVILLAESSVYPDDKENFKDFFDLDLIRKNMEAGIYVTKLYFRLRREDGEYIWVKVKNIIPTKRTGSDIRFFACFRRVEKDISADLKYKQDLSDALESARMLAKRRNTIINQLLREVKTPLNGMIGMVGLALTETDDEEVRTRLLKLEDEAFNMHRAISTIAEANAAVDKDELDVDFVDHPVNRISYSIPKQETVPVTSPSIEGVPDDYAYKAGSEDTPGIIDETPFDFSGRRFLIVEDNKLNADVMTELLKSAGAEADVVGDGKAAVIKFVSQPAATYSMILMDIELPVLNGYSAARCIRIAGKDDSRTIPIYAVTANSQDEDVVRSVEYGFNAFFVKPVNFTVLFERIEREFRDKKADRQDKE